MLRRAAMTDVTLHLGNCVDYMKFMPDQSVDVILTDPPYGYLKHKLDKPFDEIVYFEEVDRILKDSGFYVSFGRGTAFYRWNTQLASQGFIFKEEIIWNKRMSSSPCLPIQRFHETVAIYAKRKGKIRESRVPYIEVRSENIGLIARDVKEIKAALKSRTSFDQLDNFLAVYESTGVIKQEYGGQSTNKHGITLGKSFRKTNKTVSLAKSIACGMKERSIIDISSNHYNGEHPTQKPVRLMERLMFLVSDKDYVVLDPFMGSGSTGIACVNQERNFIGCEILPEYYEIAQRRVTEARKEKILVGVKAGGDE